MRRSMRDLLDAELVRLSGAGDGLAFGELVERHNGTAYAVAFSIVGEGHAAEDVVQDAFLRAWSAIRGFRGDSTFRTWLCSIVANVARGSLRRRRTRREVPMVALEVAAAPGSSPEERAIRRSSADRARAFLAELPEKQRLAVALRIETGMSFREIGAALGSSEGAARVNYFHGLRKLRRAMGDDA